MGKRDAPSFSGKFVRLVLRGRHSQALVQDGDDWEMLGKLAERMLFWCGGSIYGCRCEGREIHFAVRVGHGSVGAIAHHISGAYAIRLRRRRKLSGSVFKHYGVKPFEEFYLDDLVIWLHRDPEDAERTTPYWTADAAYTTVNALPWINTGKVLDQLGGSSPRSAYRRRKAQPLPQNVIDILNRRRANRSGNSIAMEHPPGQTSPGRPSMETIARAVGIYCSVPYEDMLSASRKRPVSKARLIAAVFCTRNGASAAAVARLFHQTRSSLIEQAERLRKTQPQIFADAAMALHHLLI